MTNLEHQIQPHERTKLYQLARSILKDTHILASRMPKQFKFTLGTKLIDQATSLTLSIFLAYEEVNDRNRKLQLVKEINHHLQALLLSYRIAYDVRAVSTGERGQIGFGKQVQRLVACTVQQKQWVGAIVTDARI